VGVNVLARPSRQPCFKERTHTAGGLLECRWLMKQWARFIRLQIWVWICDSSVPNAIRGV